MGSLGSCSSFPLGPVCCTSSLYVCVCGEQWGPFDRDQATPWIIDVDLEGTWCGDCFHPYCDGFGGEFGVIRLEITITQITQTGIHADFRFYCLSNGLEQFTFFERSTQLTWNGNIQSCGAVVFQVTDEPNLPHPGCFVEILICNHDNDCPVVSSLCPIVLQAGEDDDFDGVLFEDFTGNTLSQPSRWIGNGAEVAMDNEEWVIDWPGGSAGYTKILWGYRESPNYNLSIDADIWLDYLGGPWPPEWVVLGFSATRRSALQTSTRNVRLYSYAGSATQFKLRIDTENGEFVEQYVSYEQETWMHIQTLWTQDGLTVTLDGEQLYADSIGMLAGQDACSGVYFSGYTGTFFGVGAWTRVRIDDLEVNPGFDY